MLCSSIIYLSPLITPGILSTGYPCQLDHTSVGYHYNFIGSIFSRCCIPLVVTLYTKVALPRKLKLKPIMNELNCIHLPEINSPKLVYLQKKGFWNMHAYIVHAIYVGRVTVDQNTSHFLFFPFLGCINFMKMQFSF